MTYLVCNFCLLGVWNVNLFIGFVKCESVYWVCEMWICLLGVWNVNLFLGEYFRAISHYHISLVLLANLNHNNNDGGKEAAGFFHSLYIKDAANRKILETAHVVFPPRSVSDRKLLGKKVSCHYIPVILKQDAIRRVCMRLVFHFFTCHRLKVQTMV